MTDVSKTASFGVGSWVRSTLKGVRKAPAGAINSVKTATTPQVGFLDRAIGVGTLASVPIGVAGMVVPNADTRAVESMRKADAAREAQGLKPLAMTPQLIAEKAAAMSPKTMSSTVGDIRTTNPAPAMLPGDLPPGSLRR